MSGRRRPLQRLDLATQTLLDAVAEAVYLRDAEQRLLYLNPACERLLGRAREELIGRSCCDALGGVDGECAAGCPFERRDGSHGARDWSRRTVAGPAGQPLVVAAAARPWPAGEPGLVVVTLRPADEHDPVVASAVAGVRHTAELCRQREHEASEARQAEILQAIAGGVAHRFNNLLAAILGQAENAQSLLDVDRDEVTACLSGIVDASLEAGRLVRSLATGLGVARSARDTVDLRQVVDRAVGEAAKAVAGSTVQVAHADTRLAVRGDAVSLGEVAGALIANALEAVAGDGTVTVRTAMVEVDGGRHVVLEVADDGCGMDAETERRMFDPFFSTKFVGRGLSLAVVREVVHRHGGSIAVVTSPGRGTVVTVSLPAASSAPAATGHEARESGWRGGGLVLVVEGEPAVREVISAALTRLGFDVLAAGGADEALAHLARHGGRLRCVVLDVGLPRQDGEATLRRLRDHGLAAPVILCSGHDEETLARRFSGAEIAAILAKPFTVSQLGATLRRALAHGEAGASDELRSDGAN